MSDRILVVEDDEASRDALAELLRDQGYVVDTARSGSEAITLIGAQPPGLVISEMYLARGGGTESVRRLREHVAPAGIPILLVTSRPGLERRIAALGLGEGDYLTKPIDADALFERVHDLLGWPTGTVG